MAVIKLAAFAGEKPLISSRLLPETAAKTAFNVRLDDGALTPTNKAVPVIGAAAGDADDVTIYRHQGDWLSWATPVNAAPGPVAADRLYFTGDGVPKLRVSGTDYPLAVPRPAGALTATLGGSGTGDVTSRTYVYTWVTDFGEESAPSPASAIVDWKPGNTVTLSGFAATPAGRAITKQRIYRSQTGSSGTYLYLIAERAATNGNFSDTVAVDAFQEPLPSADWNEPPDDLTGLTALPNGMMAAFVGNQVYFCEPYRPHAWPEKYIMTCDSEVVGLGAVGSIIVVMTKAQPYIFSGSSPDVMQSVKAEANMPCINARGIVDLGFAICYPSNLGLVAVRADGSIGLVTTELFDVKAWSALAPQIILGGQRGGIYHLFYNTLDTAGNRITGVIMINVNAAQFLARASEIADAVFYSVDDEALYFKRPNQTAIQRFDPPDGPPESQYWRSKEFWLNRPVNFGAIVIDLGIQLMSQDALNAERDAIQAQNDAVFATGDLLGGLNETLLNTFDVNGDALLPFPAYGECLVNVYADGVLVCSLSPTGEPQRLPGDRTARRWEVDVAGNVQVTQIMMASTIDELRAAG
jgi:hypothetical protein